MAFLRTGVDIPTMEHDLRSAALKFSYSILPQDRRRRCKRNPRRSLSHQSDRTAADFLIGG